MKISDNIPEVQKIWYSAWPTAEACISCVFADSYLLTRSLPWHSTHLSPPSTEAEQSSRLFLLQPAHCLLFYSYQHQHTPECFLQTLTFFPLRWWDWLWKNKISPQTDSVFHISVTLPGRDDCLFSSRLLPPVFSFQYAACLLLVFEFGHGEMKCSHWGEGTNRQWLQMEFGQWSEIPIQKIDRTLFTNWSLKFQRGESHKCYIRSQWSFDF